MARVDYRRVLYGIFWILRSGAPWPETRLEGGFVLFPKEAHWLDTYLLELITFPNPKNDYQVDSTVFALAFRDSSTRQNRQGDREDAIETAPAARANDKGINVLQFGADPTDTNDSTAAIQAAIDYAFNNDINALTCPAGKGSDPRYYCLCGTVLGRAERSSVFAVASARNDQVVIRPSLDLRDRDL